MLKRILATFLATTLSLGAAALSSSAGAAPPEEAFEGLEFTRVSTPQPVATGSRIEVLEFFWYRCPHCFQLEPVLNTWLQGLPGDAQMRRVPAVSRERWVPAARLYYTLEQMGLADTLHDKVFHAYHIERINLDDPEQLDTWLASQGIGRGKFQAVYNAPATQERIAQASRLAQSYGASGVPSFVIDGKFFTSTTMAGNHARLFEVIDQLIVKARAERSATTR